MTDHYVVNLVHGDIETPSESLLLTHVSMRANELGSPVMLATNDQTSWEFREERDAALMMAHLRDMPDRPTWWRWWWQPGQLLIKGAELPPLPNEEDNDG